MPKGLPDGVIAGASTFRAELGCSKEMARSCIDRFISTDKYVYTDVQKKIVTEAILHRMKNLEYPQIETLLLANPEFKEEVMAASGKKVNLPEIQRPVNVSQKPNKPPSENLSSVMRSIADLQESFMELNQKLDNLLDKPEVKNAIRPKGTLKEEKRKIYVKIFSMHRKIGKPVDESRVYTYVNKIIAEFGIGALVSALHDVSYYLDSEEGSKNVSRYPDLMPLIYTSAKNLRETGQYDPNEYLLLIQTNFAEMEEEEIVLPASEQSRVDYINKLIGPYTSLYRDRLYKWDYYEIIIGYLSDSNVWHSIKDPENLFHTLESLKKMPDSREEITCPANTPIINIEFKEKV